MHICISGLTGAGKSTLAQYLCKHTNATNIASSSILIDTIGGDQSKFSRLLSWLPETPESGSVRTINPWQDRYLDLHNITIHQIALFLNH